jgi:radical SAM protein with 4Fe4S-binding SPASM domain
MAKQGESRRSYNPGVDPFTPLHVVWELTMRCDQACSHCGSRAARARPEELDTPALLEVARALVELGCREVALIGGEAYLHPGVYELTEFLSARDVRVITQTGGRGLTRARVRRWKDAGLAQVGVSVDGPEREHDILRAAPGSWRAALAALRYAREEGLATSVNTQVNRLNFDKLPETLAALKPLEIRAWRAQLTAPMGRAADRPDWILHPWQIIEVIDTLAALQLALAREARDAGLPPRRILDVQLGNNLGYYGPHEQTLRSRPGGTATWYQGCEAGRYVLSIESDGTIKACPSLPTAPYVGGNVRDRALAEAWEQSPAVRFARDRGTEELWGFCAGCMYAEICRGGCSFTAHTTLGRRGNNPFCYHRAATLKKRGRRERLRQVEQAAGRPYDFGRFEIVEEDWPAGG